MTITDALHALCAELAADGVPHPLGQSFTLAALWSDLARLAGEAVPPDVAALLDAPLVLCVDENRFSSVAD